MILNRNGDVLEYEGKKYTVGELIYGNTYSEYEGLFGVITEIRDGKDKDTENPTPDIYCAFEKPNSPYDIERLQKRFSDLYGEKKKWGDIAFDEVILSPEEVLIVGSGDMEGGKQTVYLLIEDWATNDNTGISIDVFSTEEEALFNFRLKLRDEYKSGVIGEWNNADNTDDKAGEENSENLVIESSENNFSAYWDGWYSREHYSLSIQQSILNRGLEFGKTKNSVEENAGNSFTECSVQDKHQESGFDNSLLLNDKSTPEME